MYELKRVCDCRTWASIRFCGFPNGIKMNLSLNYVVDEPIEATCECGAKMNCEEIDE